MAHTIPLEADILEAAEMETAIAEWHDQMEEMREQMRRRDAAIEEASKETRAVLADITQILTELKAA